MMAERRSLTVFTSNATRAVLDSLAAAYERESAHSVTVQSDSASVMLARIRGGDTADAAVLNAADIEELAQLGKLVRCRPFARSRIGLAVRAGTAHPDISSVEALKRALLEARSVAHTVHGASGKLVPGLLEKLGIAREIVTVTRPGGLIGKVVAAGEATVAIQQIPELLAVPGIEVVGPLPDEVQTVLESASGVFVASGNTDIAESMLRFFTAPRAAAALRERGLELAPTSG
jgi:molybdate transport system substrate-binding protein